MSMLWNTNEKLFLQDGEFLFLRAEDKDISDGPE